MWQLQGLDLNLTLLNDSTLLTILNKKCRLIRNHGALKKHQHQIEGINSRMDGLQAAILTAKLPYILSWTKERRRCANTYLKLLNGNKFVKCPLIRDNSEHSFHLFLIQVDMKPVIRQNFIG